MTFVRRTKGLDISISFFGYPENGARVDIQRVIQAAEPRTTSGWHCSEFHTLLLDLSRDEASLWQGVRSRVRRYIQSLEREGVRAVLNDRPDASDVRDFVAYHREAAAARALPPADEWFLTALAERGVLVLSTVQAGDRDLARRAHLTAGTRVRQMSAAFVPASGGGAMAHANHFLQWKELLYFKERGATCYDFGGISLAPEGTRLAGIDAFKRNFGGEPVREFSGRRASSARGRVALGVAGALRGARRWMGRGKASSPAPAPAPQD